MKALHALAMLCCSGVVVVFTMAIARDCDGKRALELQQNADAATLRRLHVQNCRLSPRETEAVYPIGAKAAPAQ